MWVLSQFILSSVLGALWCWGLPRGARCTIGKSSQHQLRHQPLVSPLHLICGKIGAALHQRIFSRRLSLISRGYGFQSILWMKLCAGTLVELLEVMGGVMGLSPAFLGATVLAWGSSVGNS